MEGESMHVAEADERVVDALLQHWAEGSLAIAREARVERVMQALREPAPLVERGEGRRAWLGRGGSAAAIAALVLVSFGLFAMLFKTEPAKASALEQVVASLEAGDRTYVVHVEPAVESGLDGGHLSLEGATLYVRAGGQFVLVRTGPKGEEAYDGYDGEKPWRVRRGVGSEGPATQAATPLPRIMGEIPLVDLGAMLRQLGAGYEVTSTMEADRGGGRTMLHLHAVRRLAAYKGPPVIEIWADPATHLPARIVFERAKFQGSAEARRLVMELRSDAPLPSGWFRLGSHEGGVRR